MDSAYASDDAGFSSFFVDYQHPSLYQPTLNCKQEPLSFDRQSFSTPPVSSAPVSSISSASLFSATLTPAQATRTLVLKRKLFDNNQEALKAAIASITPDERIDLDEIENFAAYFKKQRMIYGCTQHDIGVAMGKKYGTEFSQTTISRFEALNLSFKNMCKLRPLLKEWMAEVDSALADGISINEILQKTPDVPVKPITAKSKKNDGRHRKRRTFIDDNQSVQLAEEYEKHPRPSSQYLNELAERLKLEKDVIRIWFSNHRQKIRKIEDERLTILMQSNHYDN